MSIPAPLTTIRAVMFDVFGTVVSWREFVTDTLVSAANTKRASPSFPQLPPPTQSRLQSLTRNDWTRFAEAWHASYGAFTCSFVPGVTPWKDIDTHHRDSLASLLSEWSLADVYADAELDQLALAWHFLPAWPDAAAGLRQLSSAQGYVTATLSNGNRSLLADLAAQKSPDDDDDDNPDPDNSNSNSNPRNKKTLHFDHLLSGEQFHAYKPHPTVYRGACHALGLEPGQVAMVAAHLGDLAAARAQGMRTVYVERPGEEEWAADEERYVKAREWVDVWVAEGKGEDGGFVEVARRLGDVVRREG